MNNSYKRRRKKKNMNLRLFATLSLLITGSIVGYVKLGDGKNSSELTAPVINQQVEQQSNQPDNKSNSTNNDIKKPTANISPYTGEEISKEAMENIPFMVVVENSRAARPQSGLSDADIVYETMAEGGVPRFLALFHSSNAKEIGPVRSARPYFLTLAKTYNLPFAHCGGSAEALSTIKKENLMSMNEINYGGYYWRDNSRKAPHNLYTSAEKLRRLITNKDYIQQPSFSVSFDKNFWQENLSSAQKINMKLSPYYSTSYDYKDGLYYKNMDNQKIDDKNTGNQLSAANIVIQITDIKALDDFGHLEIRQIGEGTGYILSNGKYIKMTWSKSDEKAPTLLKDEQGNAISLSPGKTWWHITDSKATIEIN